MEAVEFAGHQGLDNLILIYDSNDVTLDAMADKTQSEDTGKRFKAIGWDVQTVTAGNEMEPLLKAFNKAKRAQTGRPQLIIARTLIAKGIPEVEGTAKGHGESGAKFADSARIGLGLPADRHFYVSDDVRTYFAAHKKRLIRAHGRWTKTFQAWRTANPEKAALLDSANATPSAAGLLEKIPLFPADAKLATRAAGRDVLQPLAAELPLLISGSADLHGSTYNYIAADKDFDKTNRAGRNIRFGIREHAMAAMCNGFAYDGYFPAVVRDVSGVCRLLAPFDAAGRAFAASGHLYLYARLGWRRRRRPHPSTGGDDFFAARDPGLYGDSSRGSRGNRRSLCRGAGADEGSDPARAHPSGRATIKCRPAAHSPGGGAERRLRVCPGNRSAHSHSHRDRE